jgi:toxin ParE1/3/4
LRIIFHPAALEELLKTASYYADITSDVAQDFMAEVDGGLEMITEHPLAWSQIHQNARQFVLSGFPYSLIYYVAADEVRLLAITHHKRRPKYWLSRLRDFP